MLEITQNNNENFGEFTATFENQAAGILKYQWKNHTTFNIVHTEVDQKFGGKGIGKQLVKAAVEYARKNDKKIIASCSYAHAVLEKDGSLSGIFSSNNN